MAGVIALAMFTEGAAQIAAAAAALVAVGAAIEKVFSPLGRLLQKWVTSPLAEQLHSHATYVGYHLGPNGTTVPVHQRLKTLEEEVASIKANL